MAAPRRLPPVEQLAELVEQGFTHTQIADMLTQETGQKITRSAVSVALSRARLTTPKKDLRTAPWEVRAMHQNRFDLQMLRVHKRLEEGKPATDKDMKRYRSWRQRLDAEDAVIHYEPRSMQGFWWVRRRPGIDTGLVRLPEPDAGERAG